MRFDPKSVLGSRVILLTGAEELLRIETLNKLLAEAGIDEEDFDSEVLLADARPMIEWIASASTVPFLADRRTVIVRNLLRVDPFQDKKASADDADDVATAGGKNLLLDIPETGRVILVADDEVGSEERQRRAQTIDKKWRKWVTEAKGKIVECEVKPADISDAVVARCKEKGKKISHSALALLLEMTGVSYSLAIAETEKLILYVGEAPEIREDDVRRVVSATRDWNIWSLLDAVRDRKVGLAVRQLRILYGSKNKVEEVAFQSILPQFSRYFKLLWQTKKCLDQGINPTSIPSDQHGWFPKKPGLPTEKESVVSRLVPQARRVSEAQIRACLNEVMIADARLKGAMPAYDAEDTLERLLMKLGDILSPSPKVV